MKSINLLHGSVYHETKKLLDNLRQPCYYEIEAIIYLQSVQIK